MVGKALASSILPVGLTDVVAKLLSFLVCTWAPTAATNVTSHNSP